MADTPNSIDLPAVLAESKATLKAIQDLLADPSNGLATKLPNSSAPLSMTVTQPLPLIALGGVHSFVVDVPNAAIGQVVVLNPNPTIDASLTAYRANVTAAGKVTIRLTAGLAIAAGNQVFYLRVLR